MSLFAPTINQVFAYTALGTLTVIVLLIPYCQSPPPPVMTVPAGHPHVVLPVAPAATVSWLQET